MSLLFIIIDIKNIKINIIFLVFYKIIINIIGFLIIFIIFNINQVFFLTIIKLRLVLKIL